MSSEGALRRLQVLHSHLDRISNVFSDGTSALANDVNAPLINTSRAITLIGSMILDVQATPGAGYTFQQGGSVPGHLKFVPGGVARNIAHSLVLLADSETRTSNAPLPLLITVVGNDSAGKSLVDSCLKLGMNTKAILSVPGGATPCVSIIFDGGGDVAASVADVALLETQLTAAQLGAYTRDIENSYLVLIDGDLSQDAIQAVCSVIRNCIVKRPLLFFEPVSAPKSIRAVPFLSVIDYASPNIAELKAMAGAVLQKKKRRPQCERRSVIDSDDNFYFSEIEKAMHAARPLMQLVLEEGLGNVVLTLGSLGAGLCTLSADKSSIVISHAPALPATIVNCSGAGDCLVAGFLHGLTSHTEDPVHALAMGVAAAKHAVQSDSNVPTSLTASQLETEAVKIVKESIKVYTLTCGCCCESCCRI